jgi:hypothetical protein
MGVWGIAATIEDDGLQQDVGQPDFEVIDGVVLFQVSTL